MSKEKHMKISNGRSWASCFQIGAAVMLMGAASLHAQQAPPDAVGIQALTDAVSKLQGQVHSMQEQMRRLQAERDDTRAELDGLKRELAAAKTGTPAAADEISADASKYPTATSIAELSAGAEA